MNYSEQSKTSNMRKGKTLLNFFLSKSPKCRTVNNRTLQGGRIVNVLKDVPTLEVESISSTSFNEKWYLCSKSHKDGKYSLFAVGKSGWNEKVTISIPGPFNYSSSIRLVSCNDSLIAATCTREEHNVYKGCCKGQLFTYEAHRDKWYQIPTTSLYGQYDCRTLIGHDNCLYLIEGIPDDRKRKSLQFMDMRTSELHNLALMPEDRQGAGACFHQKNLYISGGITEQSFSIFDLSANRWRAVNPLPESRNLHKMFVIDESLFVVGGCPSNSSSRASFKQIIYTTTSLLEQAEIFDDIWSSIKCDGKYVVDSFVL